MRVALLAGAFPAFRRDRRAGRKSGGRGGLAGQEIFPGECYAERSDFVGVGALSRTRRASKRDRFNARFDDVITALETEPLPELRWSMCRLLWPLSLRPGQLQPLPRRPLFSLRDPFTPRRPPAVRPSV